jgi:hypothetical protein
MPRPTLALAVLLASAVGCGLDADGPRVPKSPQEEPVPQAPASASKTSNSRLYTPAPTD